MNRNIRVIGLAALTIGALAYPAMLLYKKWSGTKKQDSDNEEHANKAFAPNYLSSHKPHHRHGKVQH